MGSSRAGGPVDLDERIASPVTAEDAAMLASIAASSQDSILSTDRDGVVLWANDATRKVLGWRPAELVGHNISVLVPDDGRTEQLDCRQRILAGEIVPPYVGRRVRRDGAVIDVAITAGAVRDADGTVVGISSIVRDVTEQLRTEEELRRALQAHRARFEQAALPQALVALDGTFLSVNQALCAMVGRSDQELVGSDLGRLAHPLDSGQATADLLPLIRGEVESATYERLARRPEGQPLPVLLDVTLLRDQDGAPYAMAMFARDLTGVREAQQRLTAQESLFRALTRRSSDASVVTDADLNITYVSPSATEIFGYRPDDVLAMLGWDFVHPDDVERVRPLVETVAAEPDSSKRFSYRLRDASGRWRWVEQTLTNCLTDPDIGGMVINLRDISERVEAEQALRDSETRYRAIVRTAQEGILAMGADGHTLFANQKIADITGVPLEQIYRKGMLATIPEELGGQLRRRLETCHETGPEEYEVRFTKPDGDQRVLSVSASPLALDEGVVMGALAMVSDVTDARHTEQRLRWQALHDPLTGLPNRSLLIDRLQMATARLLRGGTNGVAVLFMDLDQFKLINDSRGHQVGDRMLCEVAERLQRAVRRTDTVARLGGDEFAVVCEDADEETAMQIAARIHEVLQDPVDLDGELLYAGTSIGIAMSPPHPADALLRFADAAMYRAKAGEQHGTVVFDEELATDSERRFSVSNALREGLRENRVKLRYQPIYDLVTETVCGVEAMLEGIEVSCGDVSAAELLEIADASGLSFELDRAVLRAAVAQFAALRAGGAVAGDVYLSVNLATRSLGRALDDVVDRVLTEASLPGHCLQLEFTDNSIMADVEHAIASLGRLRDRGVRTSIDNFGNGNSSLVNLRRLPLTALAIDPWFVGQVGAEAESDEIVRAVVSVAKATGLCTVARGVQTREQADAMRVLGCDRAQGTFWGSAVDADSVAELIAR